MSDVNDLDFFFSESVINEIGIVDYRNYTDIFYVGIARDSWKLCQQVDRIFDS